MKTVKVALIFVLLLIAASAASVVPTVNAAGAPSCEETINPREYNPMALSPVGNQIVTVCNTGMAVVTLNSDGSALKENYVTDKYNTPHKQQWSVDGKYVYTLQNDGLHQYEYGINGPLDGAVIINGPNNITDFNQTRNDKILFSLESNVYGASGLWSWKVNYSLHQMLSKKGISNIVPFGDTVFYAVWQDFKDWRIYRYDDYKNTDEQITFKNSLPLFAIDEKTVVFAYLDDSVYPISSQIYIWTNGILRKLTTLDNDQAFYGYQDTGSGSYKIGDAGIYLNLLAYQCGDGGLNVCVWNLNGNQKPTLKNSAFVGWIFPSTETEATPTGTPKAKPAAKVVTLMTFDFATRKFVKTDYTP